MLVDWISHQVDLDIFYYFSSPLNRSSIFYFQDRLIASFLAPQIGAVFNARIGGVVGAGLFVNLEETGADGFVSASSLGRDYYVYDEVRHALVGQRTGETFQMGDTVQVKLVEAAPVKGGLRFDMVSEGRAGKPSKLRGDAGKRKPKRRR